MIALVMVCVLGAHAFVLLDGLVNFVTRPLRLFRPVVQTTAQAMAFALIVCAVVRLTMGVMIALGNAMPKHLLTPWSLHKWTVFLRTWVSRDKLFCVCLPLTSDRNNHHFHILIHHKRCLSKLLLWKRSVCAWTMPLH